MDADATNIDSGINIRFRRGLGLIFGFIYCEKVISNNAKINICFPTNKQPVRHVSFIDHLSGLNKLSTATSF